MQQLTLNIPDSKLPFFMELIQNLGFVHVDKKPEHFILSEQQKQLIETERERASNDANYMLDWEDAKNKFNLG